MARYGKKASEKVEAAMHEKKRGELKSGKSGKPVASREQAIAIGLSQARKAGAKGALRALPLGLVLHRCEDRLDRILSSAAPPPR